MFNAPYELSCYYTSSVGYKISQWCALPCSAGSSSPVLVPSPWLCWHSTPGRLAPDVTT